MRMWACVMMVGMLMTGQVSAKVGQLEPVKSDYAQATQMLEKRGYKIQTIRQETQQGASVLKIEAQKDQQTSNIIMAYPSLKILSETRTKP